MAPASSTWVCIVAKSPISAPVCDCADLRALALRPACISTTGLPAARRAPAGGEERLRPADLLGVERDHARRAVIDQEFEEVGGFEAGLVAGRDHVGERNAAAVGRALEVAEQAAALADEGDAVLTPRSAWPREQHVQHHAVDVVGDAETVRPDHGKPCRPRRVGRRRPAWRCRRPRQSPPRTPWPSRPCGARRTRSPRAPPRPAA